MKPEDELRKLGVNDQLLDPAGEFAGSAPSSMESTVR